MTRKEVRRIALLRARDLLVNEVESTALPTEVKLELIRMAGRMTPNPVVLIRLGDPGRVEERFVTQAEAAVTLKIAWLKDYLKRRLHLAVLRDKHHQTVCVGCYDERYNQKSDGPPPDAPTDGSGCWNLVSIRKIKGQYVCSLYHLPKHSREENDG